MLPNSYSATGFFFFSDWFPTLVQKSWELGRAHQAPLVNRAVPQNLLLAKLRQHHSLCFFEQKLLGSAIWWNSTKVFLNFFFIDTTHTTLLHLRHNPNCGQDVTLLWYSLFCKMFNFHMNTSEQERRPQTACQKNADAQRQMQQLCKAHLASGSLRASCTLLKCPLHPLQGGPSQTVLKQAADTQGLVRLRLDLQSEV